MRIAAGAPAAAAGIGADEASVDIMQSHDPARLLPRAHPGPAPGRPRVHRLRRALLRPAQRLRRLPWHGLPARACATEGTVRTFTIVHMAAPGVKVPFVAAVVDCGGTQVRANLINVPADPEHVRSACRSGSRSTPLGTDDEAPRRSASASSQFSASHRRTDVRGFRLGARHPHDQVRQAPGQGPDRPRVRGLPRRARRRRRHHGADAGDGLRQPDAGEHRPRPAGAEADRPVRHPRLQRHQRLRHRRHRAAYRHARHQGGRGRPRSRRRGGEAVRRGPAGRRQPQGGRRRLAARGPLRRGGAARRPGRHGDHAGRLRPGRPGVRAHLRRHERGAVRQDLGEEPRPLDAEPARRLPEAVHPGGDPRRHHDLLPEHPPHVLGEHRRRGGGRARQRGEAGHPRPGAAAPRGEGLRLGADQRPVRGGLPGPAEREHADPQRGEDRLPPGGRLARRPEPGGAARLLRHRGTGALRQPDALPAGRRRRLLRVGRPLARRPPPGERVRRPAVQGPPHRRHRHRQRLRGRHPPARRGGPPADRGRPRRPDPRHRPRLRLRHPHPGEIRSLNPGPGCARMGSITDA